MDLSKLIAAETPEDREPAAADVASKVTAEVCSRLRTQISQRHPLLARACSNAVAWRWWWRQRAIAHCVIQRPLTPRAPTMAAAAAGHT